MSKMTQLQGNPPATPEPMEKDYQAVKEIIYNSIDDLNEKLRGLNRKVNSPKPNILNGVITHDSDS
jgi:hypothetical protein